jgi:hypothetical protein
MTAAARAGVGAAGAAKALLGRARQPSEPASARCGAL